MTKISLTALFFFLLTSLTFAQKTAYFQQRVDYRIDATLNDENFTLTAEMEIDYTNNSSEVLNSIYFNLWGNAYSNDSTAFAMQQLKDGKTTFQKSKPEERGGYEKIAFFANGEELKWTFFNGHRDMCKVELRKPLAAGEKMTFKIPFQLRIPRSFSRLGREDESYQLTQWYPKPAVLDNLGWHPMHYLDWGEFYSEFGSFDVKFTCPAAYVVGATGVLQTESENKWLDELAEISTKAMKKKKYKPALREGTKTLHYIQDNVHDFALFLDKKFLVQKGEFELPNSKRKITSYAMFPIGSAKKWKAATGYLKDAVLHYSHFLGEYPYDYVTAVESALSAGSGMEYPMITVIGEEANDFELDLVITHEVGHNWFYGILGSNERMHAWMDEGLNSFYETRYVLKKYPNQKLESYYEKLRERAQMEKMMYQNGHQIRSLVLDQMQPMQSMATPLDALPSSFFYFVYHYDKAAALFFHLLAYLGEEKLDQAMRTYYAQWQFKHPYPKDLRAVLEAETGKNLAWLFEDLIEKNKKIDVEISSCVVEGETIKLKLSNKGETQVPLPLQFLDKNKNVLFSIWIEPFSGEKTIEKQLAGVVSAVLDFDEVTLDLVKQDNHCK